MCRNIRTLFNFEPPATEAEIHDAALQFVRKLSGFQRPSNANAVAFDRAVGQAVRGAGIVDLASTSATDVIRIAAADDAESSAGVYNYYMRETVATFEDAQMHGALRCPPVRLLRNL
jgi:hypothetical protein